MFRDIEGPGRRFHFSCLQRKGICHGQSPGSRSPPPSQDLARRRRPRQRQPAVDRRAGPGQDQDQHAARLARSAATSSARSWPRSWASTSRKASTSQIQPGGPSIDGVAVVASGRFEVGQVSSSPSLMLAVSQGLPIKCFAVGIQKHPYCFFSLKKKPIRKPRRTWSARRSASSPPASSCCARCWRRTRSPRRTSPSSPSAPT